MDFEGKTALIVGGAQGLGAAVVTKFLRDGVRVVVVDEPLDGIGTSTKTDSGQEVVSFSVRSLSDEADVVESLARTMETLGKLDVLVLSTAVSQAPMSALDMTAQLWDLQATQNVRSVWLWIKHASRHMALSSPLTKDGGAIVIVSSDTAIAGAPGLSAFSTAQWCVRGLVQSASQEFAPLNIRTNSIHPICHPVQHMERSIYPHSEKIAEVIVFLSSPRASYVNGLTAAVTGGKINWG